MRRALAASLLALSVAGTGLPAFAKDVVTVTVCDLDGHCDRHCTVNTDNVVRCGYGPS